MLSHLLNSFIVADELFVGIIEAVKQSIADVIVMGSHGNRGFEALSFGSQAAILPAYTKVPALVTR